LSSEQAPLPARWAGRDGEIQRTTLPGGLRVVTESMPASRTFSVGVFVGVGSRHESDRLHGASHFLEHVLFKGTARRRAEEIAATVESVGGDLNAYTAKEHTCFYAKVLDTDADLAVDVLVDMMQNSLVTAADVDAERAVILDEIAMHADDPTESVQELANPLLYGDDGLGRSVIGSTRSIARLSRRQVVGHWRRRYRPEAIVVAAAGHVDHQRLVEQVAGLDCSSPAKRPREVEVRPRDPKSAVVKLPRRLGQCSVLLGLAGPAARDPRRYPLGLLSLVAGGGMSSRLFVEVRERRGLTYGIDAGETFYSDAGHWSVEWQCAPGKVAEIVALVRGTMADLAADGITAEELERAKGQVRGQSVLSFESAAARMNRLGTAELLGDQRTIEEILAAYDRVELAAVQAEAQRLYESPPVLAVVGPTISTRRLERALSG
jgi:predicted Zn-dependent peptidase